LAYFGERERARRCNTRARISKGYLVGIAPNHEEGDQGGLDEKKKILKKGTSGDDFRKSFEGGSKGGKTESRIDRKINVVNSVAGEPLGVSNNPCEIFENCL